MKSFVRIGLSRTCFCALALSLLAAGFSSAAVIVDFRQPGGTTVSPGPATATVTLSDLTSDPVTLTSPDQGGPYLPNAANDSFTDNVGYTGEIDLVFQVGTVGPLGLAAWDVAIAANGHVNRGSPGWGVHPSNTGPTGNSQISGNELLLFTFDTDFATTGSNPITFESARVGDDSFEIWHRTGPNSGQLIIFGTAGDVEPISTFELTDGDMFAIKSVGTGTNRLRSLTFEIIPEPTAIGLASLGLAGLLMTVRRRRR
jgi:hypothetical protein